MLLHLLQAPLPPSSLPCASCFWHPAACSLLACSSLLACRTNLGWLPTGLRWLMLRHEPILVLMASQRLMFELGCLPQLETLALCDGALPNLVLVAPALKMLSIRIYKHMLSNLQLLQRHPTLQTIMMSIETLQSPNHLPLFLPDGCTVNSLTTRFRLGDVSSGLPPPLFLPRIFNMTASTHEPTDQCNTDLAPLSACCMLRSLTVIVLGDKLMLRGLHRLPPSLRLIKIRYHPAHPPSQTSHQLTPGWGCRLANPDTQDMIHLYRLSAFD